MSPKCCRPACSAAHCGLYGTARLPPVLDQAGGPLRPALKIHTPTRPLHTDHMRRRPGPSPAKPRRGLQFSIARMGCTAPSQFAWLPPPWGAKGIAVPQGAPSTGMAVLPLQELPAAAAGQDEVCTAGGKRSPCCHACAGADRPGAPRYQSARRGRHGSHTQLGRTRPAPRQRGIRQAQVLPPLCGHTSPCGPARLGDQAPWLRWHRPVCPDWVQARQPWMPERRPCVALPEHHGAAGACLEPCAVLAGAPLAGGWPVQALQELREGVPVVKHQVAHAQEGQLHQVARPRILRSQPPLSPCLLADSRPAACCMGCSATACSTLPSPAHA